MGNKLWFLQNFEHEGQHAKKTEFTLQLTVRRPSRQGLELPAILAKFQGYLQAKQIRGVFLGCDRTPLPADSA